MVGVKGRIIGVSGRGVRCGRERKNVGVESIGGVEEDCFMMSEIID